LVEPIKPYRYIEIACDSLPIELELVTGAGDRLAAATDIKSVPVSGYASRRR
jgi:hypothetical protein